MSPVYVIVHLFVVTWYCTQALDASTGAQLWWFNGTASIINAILSTTGDIVFLSLYNGTITCLDAATGAIRDQWDMSHVLTSSDSYTMSLVPTNSSIGDVLVLGSLGFYTGISAQDGVVLWHVADPVKGEITSRPATPRTGSSFTGHVFLSSGGNYQQGAGYSAIQAVDGTTLWSKLTDNVIGSTGLPTTQGWFWQLNTLGSGPYATVTLVAMQDGASLARPVYFQSPGFTSNPVVSADGACMYLFASGTIDTQKECTLWSFCYDGNGTIATEFSALLTGINAPDRYQLALGPAAGQLTVWHDAGVLVVEAMVLQPVASPPHVFPSVATGEIVALIFGKSNQDCLSGGGNVSITPAVLAPSGAQQQPAWTLGQPFTGFRASGQCNTGGQPAVDVNQRRAWVILSCSSAAQPATTLIAQLDLGATRGTPPKVVGLCSWAARSRFGPFFFDAAVTRAGPWFLDASAPWNRTFYEITVPGWTLAYEVSLPACSSTPIGVLSGAVPVLYSNMVFAGHGNVLVASSRQDWGMRIVKMSVPAGQPLSDETLPCDIGLCLDHIAAVLVPDASTALVLGFSPFYADWPTSTLGQVLSLNTQPEASTWTGMVSQQYPTFPVVLSATAAPVALASPLGVDPTVWWVQNFNAGPRACTGSTTFALLQSVAMVGSATVDAVLMVNASIPACPLPTGQLCFAMAVAHVEVFDLE
jgi:hypothetical protein